MIRFATLLMMVLTLQMIAPRPAEAITKSRGFSSSSRVSPSVRPSTSGSKVLSFRSVAKIKSAAQGGSQTHLYAAATIAILANQSVARDADTAVRDPSALATYGVSASAAEPFDMMILWVMMAVIFGLPIIVFGTMLNDGAPRHYGRRRYGRA